MYGTRREILAALLGLGFGLSCKRKPAALSYDGRFVGDLEKDGHRLRDGAAFTPTGTPEEIPILILGGGVSGLTAAWRLMQAGSTRLLLVEMSSEPGGTARSGHSKVTRYPWGAHYLPAPTEENPELLDLVREAGSFAKGRFAETHLVAAPKERVFYRGEWHRGLYPPCSGEDRAQHRRFEQAIDHLVGRTGADGRRAFTLPTAQSSDDAKLLALDQMSMAQWLAENGFDAPLLRWYVDYACRDDFGLDADQTSAWYALHYFASRIPAPGEESAEFLTWPEGNGFLVDHLVSKIGRSRFALDTMAVSIAPHEDGRRAAVTLYDKKRRTSRVVVAERVLFALPSFLRSRLIRGFTAPAYHPRYAPWLVANVHLADRPGWVGFEPAWDNVIQESRSLGYVVATHQGGPDVGPTVWTWYLPLAGADEKRARRDLLSLSWRDAADTVVSELDRVHVDFAKEVRRVDLMKWGHGMVQPRVGTRSDPERRAAARPVGPIHFAHTDLSGVALFEEAFFHGLRAAKEIQASIATGAAP